MKWPNDLKLSDGGGRQPGCGDADGVAAAVGAAGMPPGAVSCSAWLGVAGVALWMLTTFGWIACRTANLLMLCGSPRIATLRRCGVSYWFPYYEARLRTVCLRLRLGVRLPLLETLVLIWDRGALWHWPPGPYSLPVYRLKLARYGLLLLTKSRVDAAMKALLEAGTVHHVSLW